MRHRCKQAQETTVHPVAQLLSSLSARTSITLRPTINAHITWRSRLQPVSECARERGKADFSCKLFEFFRGDKDVNISDLSLVSVWRGRGGGVMF